jgi:hypothetical protein
MILHFKSLAVTTQSGFKEYGSSLNCTCTSNSTPSLHSTNPYLEAFKMSVASRSHFRTVSLPSTTLVGYLGRLLLYLAGLFTQRFISGASYLLLLIWKWGNIINKRTYPFGLGDISFNLPSVTYFDTGFTQIEPLPSELVFFRATVSNASFLSTTSTSDVLKSDRIFVNSNGLSSVSSLYQLLVFVAITFTALRVFRFAKSSIGFRTFSNQNACLPMRVAPNPFPWKLRRYFELSKIDANLLDDYLLKKFQNNGLTHGFATVFTKKIKAVATIEPANFQAVLATRFDDWERPKFRAGAAKPFLKVGILTLVRCPLF